MRKGLIISLILSTCMLIGSVVYAHFPGGFGSCLWKQQGEVDIEKVKAFQKDTMQLRDELVVKRLSIQQEYAKAAPDRQEIASLQKEIIDIRAQIYQKADETGIRFQGCGKIGKRMVGKKMMMGGHQCPVRL
jgi:zinc resistance-associated protein